MTLETYIQTLENRIENNYSSLSEIRKQGHEAEVKLYLKIWEDMDKYYELSGTRYILKENRGAETRR